MKIVLVGGGSEGHTLASRLAEEKHDVVVVDEDERQLEEIGNTLDVLCVEGNGASKSTLLEAGADHCDLLVALTKSDEFNLLSCLIARKLGASNTIAYVRNPIYSESVYLIKEDLRLSMSINPDLAAANEVARLLRFSSALRVDTFAKGRVEILTYRIGSDSPLANMVISDLRKKFGQEFFICAVDRADDVHIPNGSFQVLPGDRVSFVAPMRTSVGMFRRLGFDTGRIQDVMIVGGGEFSFYLAKNLCDNGIRVKLIEQDRERCEELSELLPDAMIICGDGTDTALLAEERVEDMGAFASFTGSEEQNAILSMYVAKNFPHVKVITKIAHTNFYNMFRDMDIGSPVHPKYVAVDYINRYARALQNSVGSQVLTLHTIVGNKVEALEFVIRPQDPFIHTPISKLKLKSNLLLACINRQGRVFTPTGADTMEPGDTVIVVTVQKGIGSIRDIFR